MDYWDWDDYEDPSVAKKALIVGVDVLGLLVAVGVILGLIAFWTWLTIQIVT